MCTTRSSARLAGCLVLAGSAFLLPQGVSSAAGHGPTEFSPETGDGQQQRLAVVVPAYRGDLERAVSSLGRWPSTCSPVTEQNVDLVLYYAEGEEDSAAVKAAFDVIEASAGRCFSKTKTVFAHLAEEEDAYPKGPSVMFYKMFLDEVVRSELSDYDALAIMEWDVLVATDNSFEELYHAAFRGNEDFWVKGSNLEGTNFHSSATVSEMWHVLGHINGNAIYNNNDPAFVDYVDYTRTRWTYTYPYDVALWLTISDFPYSWPLYQRYSNKFVTTNLIAYVGHDHVDHSTVSDAIAGKTLFIHGSSVDEGNIASIKATKPGKKKHNKTSKHHKTIETSRTRQRHRRQRRLQKWRDDQRWKTEAKWQGDADNDVEPRWRSEQKWKGNNDNNENSNDSADLPKWKQTKKWKSNVCDDGCESNDGDMGRACDTTCNDGDPWGKLGCSALDSLYGNYCRVCYNNIEMARENDTDDDRAIMCETMEPVVVYRRLNTVDKESAPGVARRLQKWRDNQRWKTTAKWQGDADNDVEPRWRSEQKWKGTNNIDDSDDPADLPKWKQEKKWKSNVCDDGCESNDGDMGRACDTTCSDGEPYGKLGCSALDSMYGNYCRVCYNSIEMARENDTDDDRAIMCDTMEPVVVYRRLNTGDKESAPRVARKLQKWRDNQRWKTIAKWQGDADNDVEPRWKREQKWKGNNNDTGDSNDSADLPKWKQERKWESNVCDDGCESNDGDMGRACDTTCSDGDPYGKLGCSALDSQYGNYCRVCYNNIELARENDTDDDRAIMCDTMEPVVVYRRLNSGDKESAPRVARKLQKWRDNQRWKTIAKWQGDADNDVEPRWKREQKWKGDIDETNDSNDPADLPKWKQEKKWKRNVCGDGCESYDGDMGRVCDTTCSDGDPYGKLGCSALDSLYGNYCRVCYNNIEMARENDTDDDRAIMCDTMEPVVVYRRRLSTVDRENAPGVARRLQKWRENQKWKTIAKWQGDADNDVEPRWKREQKWKGNNGDTEDSDDPADIPKWKQEKKWENNVCDDGCESDDGDMGRVCDTTCSDGEPYGKLGCSALDSLYGNYCRVCYNNIEMARENDSDDDRAIMCDTLEPAVVYTRRRRLEPTNTGAVAASGSGEDAPRFFSEAAQLPYTEELVRNNLCAFVSGQAAEVDQAEVTVMSILQFVPGMRVAIATEADGVANFDMVVGDLPGVTVSSTSNVLTAGLFADEYCGAGTSLIFYVRAGSVVSREFTAKDTHSPHGDLLVVYSKDRTIRDETFAKQTTVLLGFEAPSFTHGTDLILPSRANADLRSTLAVGSRKKDGQQALVPDEVLSKLKDRSDVPQMLAALQYSRNTPGIWFFNPQTWLSHNLFKTTPIWEIPLVKPRFTCELYPSSNVENNAVAGILQRNLDFFAMGGTCEDGQIVQQP